MFWVFISFNIMFSRFNHAIARIRTSFLLMDYNYSILCVYYILPSHVLMNIWIVSTFWQLWIIAVNNLHTCFCSKLVFRSIGSVLRRRIPYMVIWCLSFWGNSKLFSAGATQFYIPTSNAVHECFSISTSSPILVIFLFNSHSSGV